MVDTSVVSRVFPAVDVVAPRATAGGGAVDSENPPEKVVTQAKSSAESSLQSRQQQDPPSVGLANVQRGYVDLPNKQIAYQVIQGEGFSKNVLIQIPSEEAVKLRVYLEQQDMAKQRRQQLQDSGFAIVA